MGAPSSSHLARPSMRDAATAPAPAMQRIGAFTALAPLIRQFDVDPIPIFRRAGVSATAFDDPDARIPYVALGRILREAAARTRCAHFGLLAGRVWHLSDLGVVGQLVRNTPTVGEALHKLNVHQHLNCEGAVPFLRETAGVADFGIAIYDAGVTGLEQLFDAYIATNMNFARELCGPTWTPTAVFIPSAKPHDFTHHRHFLNVSPTFNAEFCAIRFSAHWLRKAVNGADPALLQLAESQVSCDKVPSIVQQASRALRILFLDSKYSGDDVAQALSMHRRTLNRRLHDEGTTFQAVLDDVRFELARQLISSSHIALDDVAASLGYAGASPFTRRFTRWSGMTPGDWRRHFGHDVTRMTQGGDGSSERM